MRGSGSAESIRVAAEGADACFLITPVGRAETALGLNAVTALSRRGIRRIVYLSVVMPMRSDSIPHFRSKIPIEDAIKSAGVEHTILHPNNFFQNDLLFKDPILRQGIYPEPIGSIGLNRIELRDIADAAVHALLEAGRSAGTYSLVGPDIITGESAAETYSRHLRAKIRYAGNDLAQWRKRIEGRLPIWMVEDLQTMFQYFQDYGLRATPSELTETTDILHHEPRPFHGFVAETTQCWQSVP